MNLSNSIQIKLSPGASPLTKGSDNAAGWDIYANPPVGSVRLQAHEHTTIPTGVFISLPHNAMYARIAPRSGLAAKQGIDVLAGVIDADYRGEILVILHNTNPTSTIIDLTKPIAQIIFESIIQVPLIYADTLDETIRGEKGFGSSDYKPGQTEAAHLLAKEIISTFCTPCLTRGIRAEPLVGSNPDFGNLCEQCFTSLVDTEILTNPPQVN